MKYYIIAGEASGDLHGSNLMKGLYAQDPDAQIRFWGGDLMTEVWRDVRNLSDTPSHLESGLVRHFKEGAVMGFVEVLMKAKKLLGNVRFCKEDILAWQPDVVILIDYPGFNFKIAEFAHKAGFKVFYYIAPKVWASREGRIKKLKQYVDKLYIVFPFEIPYFQSKGVDFIYKGNPLVDAIDFSQAANETREDFFQRNGIENKPTIAMLAGSRKGEISTMMPVLVEFASKLRSNPHYADYQFIVAGAPSRTMADYEKYLDPSDKGVRVIFGQTQNIIRHSQAAVVNSGTASLETVLLGTPQVVGYISSPITIAIAKLIIKIKYISLGNLIINRLAFKELIQNDCNSDSLVAEVRRLIEDKDYREAMIADYNEIREALGGKGASAAVAQSMLSVLQGKE
jgi:lipid-A-disaccharide synthase